MKKIKIFLLSLASSIGAIAADIDVTPGQLESLLGDAKDQTELKLKGIIDARDLAALEKLPGTVKNLDLSEVKIASLSMPDRKYFGRTLFSEGEIPAYTFFKSGVTTLLLPSETSIICEGAFAGSNIEQIVIPEGITALGDYAFYGCPNLTSVTLPSTLRTIGKGAFGNCMELKTLDLSNTAVTEIPERAFAGSMELKELKLPASVRKVGREAFTHTAIESLNLSGATEFEPYALSGMPFLAELTINPEAELGDGLLMDNTSLSSLTGVPELVPAYFAANCGSLATSTLNNASELGAYSFANTLSPEEGTLIIDGSITAIRRGALSGLNGIEKIDVCALEDRIPEVEENSFEGLNQQDIVLWVTDDSFEKWEADPVWSLFMVKSANKTGIDEIGAESTDNISIALRGGMIVVESPSVISDVRIYTTDGRIAYVASPWQERVEIETASLPSGILIVAASDEDGNAKTVSLLVR